MELKAYLERMIRALPGLRKLTASVLKGTAGVTAPCAGLLLAFYMLETAGTYLAWPAGFMTLLALVMSVAATPVAAGMITYAAGASWEGRSAALKDAYHLARIRLREIVITGLVAGAAVMLAKWLASMIYSLIGIVPALLGWIPLIGPVVTAAVSAVVWLISLLMEFIAHAALVMGMLALTADGISGRPQAERVLAILRGGRENMLNELALVFGLWIILQGVYGLMLRLLPLSGALASGILPAALTAVSMAAVSVIYLKERDRQDGMRYHV